MILKHGAALSDTKNGCIVFIFSCRYSRVLALQQAKGVISTILVLIRNIKMTEKTTPTTFEPIDSEELLAQVSGGNLAPLNTATLTDSCDRSVCDTEWDNGHL
ncbi:hypothetical protein PSBY109024_03020 [Pseudoalteromonas byunsanensis]